jgi:thiol-disulfide isomerase/thioredoxin
MEKKSLETLNVGRFAIPVAPLLLLGAMTVGAAVAFWNGRRNGNSVEPLLFAVFFAGLAVGRAAFVAEYLDQYMEQPWRILDIRDQGFAAVASIAGAMAMAAWLCWSRKPARRTLLYSLAAAAGFLGAGMLALSLSESNRRPTPLPDIALSSLEGASVRIPDFRGRPVVINIWATWCPPCRRELPVLRDAQARCGDVVFVFADQGETADTIRAHLASQSLALHNVLLDTRFELSRQTKARAYPTTLFFNAHGHLVDRHTGELSPATLARQLKKLGACTTGGSDRAP